MPDPEDPIQFVADRGDARLRLDQVIVRRVKEISRLSRSVAQQWIESGGVRVDGQAVRRPSTRVRSGAAIAIAVPPTASRRSTPEPEQADVHVLYEDASLIALDKPAGIVVHPSYKQLSGTLLNAVLWRLRDRPGVRPGILTRLDKDTSGLVVVALGADVHATLQREAAAGRIRKEYLAIVKGRPRPAAGTIRKPLARDPDDRRRVIVTPGGADSETRYEVLESGAAMSLVRCELVTGRTHQIRVHLASCGWPIVGDRVYGPAPSERRESRGAADATIARQALHAWRITLPHPISGEALTIVAPVPSDMSSIVSGLPHSTSGGGL